MDLQPYVDGVRHELNVAAAAGGPDAAKLADRLRGRDPEFTVDPGVEDLPDVPAVPESDDEGGTWRVTLRLPDSLRAQVEAARSDGLSVNAWLVRAVSATLGGGHSRRPHGKPDKHFSGWVR
jgi:hypothetical protein